MVSSYLNNESCCTSVLLIHILALFSSSEFSICCTLREDLLVEVAKIATSGEFDYLLIESTGVSEPMPVAGKSALVLFL